LAATGQFANNDKDSRPAILSQSGNTVAALRKRYKDGYLVSKAIETFGTLLKIGAVIAGAGIIFIGFVMGAVSAKAASGNMLNPGNGEGAFIAIFIVFGIIGAIVVAIGWVLGVMVSAQGQILKANLDTAVNSSTFLTDMSKAEIMSLPSN
jgi:hypothetical protein